MGFRSFCRRSNFRWNSFRSSDLFFLYRDATPVRIAETSRLSVVEIRGQIPLSIQEVGISISIHRDLICRSKQCSAGNDIRKIASGWSVFQQNSRGVQDYESRSHHLSEISNNVVNILMKLISATAEQTVPVLCSHRCKTKIVILDRRNADDFSDSTKRTIKEGPTRNEMS